MVGGLVVGTVIFVLLLWRWRRRHLIRMGRELGSGILALPFIGHAYLFAGDSEVRMKALQTLGRDAIRNGGMTSFWLGTSLMAVVADPVVAELVLKTCLEKDDVMSLATIYIGSGSIFAPVPIWRRRRKAMLPNFGMKNLKHFVSILTEQSAVLVAEMRAAVGAGSFSVWKYFTSYTMDVITEVTLGYKLNAQRSPSNAFQEAFDDGLAMAAERMSRPWLHSDLLYKRMPVYWKQIHYRDYLWGIVTKFINSKRRELHESGGDRLESDIGTPEDGLKTFLELLVRSNERFTDLEVLEEMMVVIIAGNDTTAVGASFAMLMMSRHQDEQEMIYQELREVFGESSRPPSVEDLSRLRRLDVALRETLRLFPPVPVITRKVEKEVQLPGGVTLVPGSGVMVHLWALHRSPRLWGPDAARFRPDRFLAADKHPAFMPFSHGPRNCLGYQFAMISMKTALSSLLRQYKVLPAQHASPQSELPSIRLKFNLMMKDVDGFQVQIVLRDKSQEC